MPRPTSSEPAGSPHDEHKDTSLAHAIKETIFLVVLAVLIAQGTKAFAVQPFVVPSGSMIPTIQLYDRVIAEKITFRFVREPKQGDVVVFDNPDKSNRREKIFIKRVIAVGGQTVDIRDGQVLVDGIALKEPYTYGKRTELGTVPMPVVVPEGQVWLMGDNRPGSGDSRLFGPQPVSSIHGRAVWTYWPANRFGELD